MARDREKYSPDQLQEAENLMRTADRQWGSAEANESLQGLIKKFPESNRAGCAMLYVAQGSKDAERTKVLRDCIEKFGDCFYGDGVQVGAFARFLLADDYRRNGEAEKAVALYAEIRTRYADAIDHNGKLLVDSIKTDSQ